MNRLSGTIIEPDSESDGDTQEFSVSPSRKVNIYIIAEVGAMVPLLSRLAMQKGRGI